MIFVTRHKGRLGKRLLEAGCCPYSFIHCERKDVIINCLAKTDVDAIELAPTEAIKSNVVWLNDLLFAHPDTYLVHLSTDFVFSGLHGPYSENSQDYHPQNNYAWTKYFAEALLLDRPNTLIVRTTGLFDVDGKNLFTFIRDNLKQNKKVYLNDVSTFTPTYIPDLVEAILDCVRAKMTGVVHLSNQPVMTKYDFSVMIAERENKEELIVPTKDVFGVAKRPVYGGLVSYRYKMRSVEDVLNTIYAE